MLCRPADVSLLLAVAMLTGWCDRTRRACDTQGMPIDPVLLDILVCPVSKAPLREIEGFLISTDPESRMRYRIDGTIPVMMVDEAEQMSEDEWRVVMDHG